MFRNRFLFCLTAKIGCALGKRNGRVVIVSSGPGLASTKTSDILIFLSTPSKGTRTASALCYVWYLAKRIAWVQKTSTTIVDNGYVTLSYQQTHTLSFGEASDNLRCLGNRARIFPSSCSRSTFNPAPPRHIGVFKMSTTMLSRTEERKGCQTPSLLKYRFWSVDAGPGGGSDAHDQFAMRTKI